MEPVGLCKLIEEVWKNKTDSTFSVVKWYINSRIMQFITRTFLRSTRPPSIPPFLHAWLSSCLPPSFHYYLLNTNCMPSTVYMNMTDMILAFMELTFCGERWEGGIWGDRRGKAALVWFSKLGLILLSRVKRNRVVCIQFPFLFPESISNFS